MSLLAQLYRKSVAGVLAVCLAALVLAPAVPASALEPQEDGCVESAILEEPVETVQPEEASEPVLPAGEQLFIVNQTEEEGSVGDIDPIIFASSNQNASIDGSMYSRLSTRQKACYDALQGVSIEKILASPDHEVEVNIPGINGMQLSGYISDGVFVTNTEESRKAYRAMQNDMHVAVVALRYDRPDMVWMDGVVSRSLMFSLREGAVSAVFYGFQLPYGGREKTMRNEMLAAARRISQQAARQPDTYSRVKAAHDIIASQARYEYTPDDDLARNMTHCAYSALIPNDAYEPVCDGYSKAFKMVLDDLGIPCVLVSSATHMWNNVKMDDGLWYNVDLTWDDGGAMVKWDYFLIGSDTLVAGQPFYLQGSHVESDPFTESGATLSGKKYPTKSETAYVYLGRDYPPLRYSDVPRGQWYYEVVETVSSLGYFQGSGGQFNPNSILTRAMFAQVMANVWEVDLDQYEGLESFEDIRVGVWYDKAAAWAKASNLMEGDGKQFRPNDPISRQEMCVVLYRALGLTARESDMAVRFSDDAKIAGWARNQVYACRAAGLIQGSGGAFNPLGDARRCEAASVFANYAKYVGLL